MGESSEQKVAGEYLGKLLTVVLAYMYAGDEKSGWELYDREYKLARCARQL
jgi:hypothetical protein